MGRSYRAFRDAGGAALDDHRTVGALMRLLPDEVRQKAFLGWEKFEGKPLALRRWVRERTKLLVNWDHAGSKSVHALEDSGARETSGEQEDSEMEELYSFLPHLASGGSATREELHAFYRKKLTAQANSRQPGGGGRPSGPAARKPGRDASARRPGRSVPELRQDGPQLPGLQVAQGRAQREALLDLRRGRARSVEVPQEGQGAGEVASE